MTYRPVTLLELLEWAAVRRPVTGMAACRSLPKGTLKITFDDGEVRMIEDHEFDPASVEYVWCEYNSVVIVQSYANHDGALDPDCFIGEPDK